MCALHMQAAAQWPVQTAQQPQAAPAAAVTWTAAAAGQAVWQAAAPAHAAWNAQGYHTPAAPVCAAPTQAGQQMVSAAPTHIGQPMAGQVVVPGIGQSVQVQRPGCPYWLGGQVIHIHANGTCGVRYDDGSFDDGVPLQMVRARAAQVQATQQAVATTLPPPPPAHGMPAARGPSRQAPAVAAPPPPPTRPTHYRVTQIAGHAATSCMPADAIFMAAAAGAPAAVAAAAAAPAEVASAMPSREAEAPPLQESGATDDAYADWSGSGSEDEGVMTDFFRRAKAASEAASAKARKMATASWWKASLIEPVLQRIADVKVDIDVAPDGRDGAKDAHLDGLSNEYSEEDIGAATNGFDRSCLLGSGACGSVYKGSMRDGSEVAIKMLKNPTLAGFDDEVKVLSRFRHPNLVILMGFARHPSSGSRSLVYEFLSGGDVTGRLQRCRRGKQTFEASLRLNVALDAASGLSHLHNANPRAFHRDIKCPNILLDKNGTAKMADFGLACVSATASHKVHLASGTAGYACPEYVRTGVVTEGSEVHSFGMVLLELLTGVPPAIMKKDNPDEVEFLIQRLNRSTDKVIELLDPGAHFQEALARTLSEIGWRCIGPKPAERPLFVQLVEALRALVNEPGKEEPEAVRRLLQPPDEGNLIEATLDANVPVANMASRSTEGNLSTADANIRVAPQEVSRAADEASPARPEVCNLACIYAAGVDLRGLEEQHRSVPFRELGQDFIIGRTAQAKDLWEALVPVERLRNMLSREHIRIISTREQSEGACAFFLECLSQNGVLLNDDFLQRGSPERQICHGDVIGFLEIADAAPTGGETPARADGTPVRKIASSVARRPFLAFAFREYLGQAATTPHSPDAEQELPVNTVTGKWWIDGANLEVPVDALFGLEIQGENVYMDLPREARRLYLCSDCTASRLPTLRVGRHHQRGFWRMVLKAEYYAEGCWAFIAAEHFDISARLPDSKGSGGSGFSLRVLSSAGLLVNDAFMNPGDECQLESGDALALGGLLGPSPSSSDGGLRLVFTPYVDVASIQAALCNQSSPSVEHEEARRLPELDMSDDWSPSAGRLEAEPGASTTRSSGGSRLSPSELTPAKCRLPAVGGAGVLMLPVEVEIDSP